MEKVQVAFGLTEQTWLGGVKPKCKIRWNKGATTLIIEARYPLLQDGDGVYSDKLDKLYKTASGEAFGLARSIHKNMLFNVSKKNLSVQVATAPVSRGGRGTLFLQGGILYVESDAIEITVHPGLTDPQFYLDEAAKVAEGEGYEIVDVM